MYLGERRVITVEITSCDLEPFTIRNPTYTFKRGDKVEANGIPLEQDHELTTIIEPKASGKYTLEFRMEIGNEIIIKKLLVFVQS